MENPSELPRKDLIPWPNLNARKRFDPEAMEGLKVSIKDVGILQPLGVTLQPKAPHWIFAGERRWRAAARILKDIPVYIRHVTEDQAIKMNLTENIERKALTPMEEAKGLAKYMEATGKTQTEVAEELGKTQGWVSNRIRLLRLSEPIQELFDEGAFTQSQARDLLLPFASLPDDKWDAFCKAVGKAMLKTFKKVGRPLTEEELRAPASSVAMAMSGWLDRHDWQDDSQEIFAAHIMIPEKRWKEAPGGTVITYLFGRYPHERITRAFDMEWWEKEMHVAVGERAREDEERKREIEGGDGTVGPEGKNLEWTPALGPIPIGTDVPFDKRHVVYAPADPKPSPHSFDRQRDSLSEGEGPVRRTGNLWADPAVIPSDNLVFQEGKGGGTWYQPVVLCTDFKVYETAVSSLQAKRDALFKRRVNRQVKADIEASKRVTLSKAVPSLLAMGTTIEEKDFFTEAAEDLGVTPTWDDHQKKHAEDLNDFDCLSWAVQLQDYLAGLKAADLKAIAQLLVYRLTRSTSGSELNIRSHINNSVAFELRTKLTEELGQMIEIPEWKPTPKKGKKDEE